MGRETGIVYANESKGPPQNRCELRASQWCTIEMGQKMCMVPGAVTQILRGGINRAQWTITAGNSGNVKYTTIAILIGLRKTDVELHYIIRREM